VREKKSWTWLLTNLPPDFSADNIGQLYRLRWQIELLFKPGFRSVRRRAS
jgi:IS4 transposase